MTIWKSNLNKLTPIKKPFRELKHPSTVGTYLTSKREIKKGGDEEVTGWEQLIMYVYLPNNLLTIIQKKKKHGIDNLESNLNHAYRNRKPLYSPTFSKSLNAHTHAYTSHLILSFFCILSQSSQPRQNLLPISRPITILNLPSNLQEKPQHHPSSP